MEIKKINCNNSFTTKCKTDIDDEFLTTRDMAIALIKPFSDQLIGKDNNWIKENIKDLAVISYNNYSKEWNKVEVKHE